MKTENLSSNLFMKQVTKLFDDLSLIQNAKKPSAPVESPRITCTRLRRLRELRRELVLDTDSQSDNELVQAIPVAECVEPTNNNASFADWVLRNKQSHQQLTEINNKDETDRITPQPNTKKASGFGSFSVSALMRVAQDTNTPSSTLKCLAVHQLPEVRCALAKNEIINCEILNILLSDKESSVREALLDNKNIRREDLLKLCEDLSPRVVEKARKLLYQMAKQAVISRDNVLVVGDT